MRINKRKTRQRILIIIASANNLIFSFVFEKYEIVSANVVIFSTIAKKI